MRRVAQAIRHFWTTSIRRQLMLGIALVHAVLMTIFVVDLVERQSDFLHKQSIAQTVSLAETLATNSNLWVLANDLVGMEEVIDSQSQYPGLRYAMLLTPQGEVLSHTNREFIGQYANDPVSIGLIQGEIVTRQLIENRETIDVAVPIIANNSHIGWARVALSQEQNIAGLQVIIRDGMVYTLIAIIVGVLFAFFMAKGITGGLQHLVQISGRISRGEKAVRSDLSRRDELGQLSKNFNDMLDALEAAKESLATNEERFNFAMQGSNDGLWDYDLNTRTLYLSPRWKSMLGYHENEIGTNPSEWSARIHPDDLVDSELEVKRHVRGECPTYEHTHRVKHKDGSWRWHLERGIAVRDESGYASRLVGTSTDITERKLVEKALSEEKERALVTLNSIGDAVITTDSEGVVTFLNPVAEGLTGWSNGDGIGQPLEEVFVIVNEKTREPCINPVGHCLNRGAVVGLANNTLLISREGNEIAIEDSAAPIRDKNGDVIGVVMVFHDVTNARSLAQKMSWQAAHDALTGLLNRNEFEQRLDDMLRHAQESGSSHTLMYIDLDQFKIVNDTCGHVAGDELLKQLSYILLKHIRESDVLARLGGDEFGLLLPGCPLEKAREIANQIRKLIKEFRFSWAGKSFEVGASIGVVIIDEDSESQASVLSAADVACYAAKDLGRDRIHVHMVHDKDVQQRHGEMHWVTRINDALSNGQFALFCQEIRRTEAAGVLGGHFEILVRMLDENGDIIPPNAFIPAAERFNLMPAIDRWVVTNTCKSIRDHQMKGAKIQALEMVAINLSGNSLGSEGFFEFIQGEMEEYDILPSQLCFEITETAAIANLANASDFIHEMKALGCRFALDDFGSGLSSFSYLKNLPVNYLKIDGSFVKDMANDPIDLAMVRSINEVGHVMGIETIAEFVEDDVTLQILSGIAVDYVQGYGINKPTELSKYLAGCLEH